MSATEREVTSPGKGQLAGHDGLSVAPKFEKLEERVLLSLLGVGAELGPPEISYDSTGVVAYDELADTFDTDAVPMSLRLEYGQRPLRIQDPRDFQLHIQIAGTGQLLGGVEGSDLYVQGCVVDRYGVVFDGVLLTGEIVAYGELNAGPGTGADKFDFRFTPTGGLLMSYFEGYDIGVDMTLSYWPDSTPYDGSFAVSFDGHAQGVMGVIEKLPSSISGSVLANGAEGLAGVLVALEGTDADGNAVSMSTLTAADGSYAFVDLSAGTYALAAEQAAGYLDGDETAGSLGGVVGDDIISGIVLAGGQDATGYLFNEVSPAGLSGLVYEDLDNDGLAEGETGIAGVLVALAGTDDRGNAVSLTATTDAAGAYAFDGLRPGTYSLAAGQPIGYLDGIDSVGTLGGNAGDDIIDAIALAGGQQGAGYNFGELPPASLSGFVFEDFNNDGLIDFSERAIQDVAVTLTGTDDRGQAVEVAAVSDSDGVYAFVDLRPGVYSIVETQPAGYADGIDVLGTLGGIADNDIFSGISLNTGADGVNYNFGERPQAGSTVTSGQTATIGFWQNKNGQTLVKSLNGGENSTQLGEWLAATFPNMYGPLAGANSLAGLTNAQIASFYDAAFRAKVKAARSVDLGPAKFDCQVMATAFAAYVTNSTLAGDAAAGFGFLVTAYGVGVATFNIGDSGLAFGVADNTEMTIMDVLLATNDMSVAGRLYDMDAILRRLANEVYSAINEQGDIG